MNADEWVGMEHVDRVEVMKQCEDLLTIDGFTYNYQSCLHSTVCELIEGTRSTLPTYLKGVPGTDEHTQTSDSRFKYTVHHPYPSKLYNVVNNGAACPFGCTKKPTESKPTQSEHRPPWHELSPRPERVPVHHNASTRHYASAGAALKILQTRSLFGLELGTDFQLLEEPLETSSVVVLDHTMFCNYIAEKFKANGLTNVQPGKITPFFQDRLSASGVVFGHAVCPLGLPADQCKHTWRFYEGLDRYAYKDIVIPCHDAVVGIRLFLSRLYRGVYFEADHDFFAISIPDLIAELVDVFDLIYAGGRGSPPVLQSTKNKVRSPRQTTTAYKLPQNESTISLLSKTGFIQFPTPAVMRKFGWF